GPQLSSDGRLLAYTVDRGDVDDQIFVAVQDVGALSPSSRRLTPSSVVALDPRISPDGSRIACVFFPLNDRWAHDAQVAVIELSSGRIDVLTPTDNIINAMPRWSPDGATLAFISDRDGYFNLYTMSADGGKQASLVSEASEHNQLAWAPDGRRIAYLRNESADVQVMVADVGSGTSWKVSTSPGAHSAVSWTADGSHVCALHQSPVTAPRVMLFSVNCGGERQLATSVPGGLDDPELFVMPEHVTWESTDGLEVPGLLLTPKTVVPNGHPVLVHVHGGPTSYSLMTWDPMAQYFVARGWAMIKPNYRGSMGYGRAFTDKLHGAWGKGDLADNVTSVNALRARGLVDERRLAVWGSSAGGYATLCAMTMAPGVFKAGVEQAGLSDLVCFPRTSDRYGRDVPRSELGPIEENYELWVERSPVTHVAKVQNPLLILQGSADKRVPPSQSELMVAALQKAGKVVEDHTYEGEGHGFRACASIRDYIVRMEDFLTRHVLMR
ncbi:MAG TPA: S9 family peptidase, partial [Thermomicrobiales bacterium]|nr:S9 family peptidase [Thermomicrobiales bacterium]